MAPQLEGLTDPNKLNILWLKFVKNVMLQSIANQWSALIAEALALK